MPLSVSPPSEAGIPLVNVLARLASFDDVNTAIPIALRLARESVNADYVTVLRRDSLPFGSCVFSDPHTPVASELGITEICQRAIENNTPEFLQNCVDYPHCYEFLEHLGAKSKVILPIFAPSFTGAVVFAWKRRTFFDEFLRQDLLAMLTYFRLALPKAAFGVVTATNHKSMSPWNPDAVVDPAVLSSSLIDSQAALRRNEELLRLVLESNSLGVFDFDPRTYEGIYDEFTRAAFGVPPGGSSTAKSLLDAIHPDDLDARNQAFAAACDPHGSREYRVEYRTVGISDHAIRTVSVRGNVYFAGSPPVPARVIGTIRNITAMRREEEQLLRANLDLRQFAYAAAHDLQEPLRNISISLGALETSIAPEISDDQRDWLNEARDGATRMHHMVKDLLLYANVSRTRHDGSPTNASQCLEIALQNLRPSILETQPDIEAMPLPDVPVNQSHLVSLFQNLLSNAIKFAKPDQRPNVKIAAARTKSHWHFSVTDSGIGFEPAYANRIFGMFKRLNTRNEFSGNGIGLAICARIVHANHGRIWAEGRPDHGATFHFTLPIG